ncbi:hypothetical protein [Pelagibacterium lentulum]|uniref:Uncharacterized protein n=1 Tax=Pelagibacterium lentulum TaxID=2029865 RepID=A0A916VUW6_9HYPH|nr:hypothetical protein [Pelagibacterium lentulum]GGA37674.1 hypothetical protein GCM10011499_03780 [Pelagibacterium lentulum]
MTNPVRHLAAPAFALVLAFGSAAPAIAFNDIPDEADFLLWCASAFHLMGIVTENNTESENFLIASEVLLDMAANELIAADIAEEEIIGLVGIYDERLVAEFEAGADLSYTADECLAAF